MWCRSVKSDYIVMYILLELTLFRLSSPYDVGGAGLGIGAEKEKKYVKDTILYDLLEVDPAASQGDTHHMTDLLCCAQSLLLVELVLL